MVAMWEYIRYKTDTEWVKRAEECKKSDEGPTALNDAEREKE